MEGVDLPTKRRVGPQCGLQYATHLHVVYLVHTVQHMPEELLKVAWKDVKPNSEASEAVVVGETISKGFSNQECP